MLPVIFVRFSWACARMVFLLDLPLIMGRVSGRSRRCSTASGGDASSSRRLEAVVIPLPMLMATGWLSRSPYRAVREALFGVETASLRTPKYHRREADKLENKSTEAEAAGWPWVKSRRYPISRHGGLRHFHLHFHVVRSLALRLRIVLGRLSTLSRASVAPPVLNARTPRTAPVVRALGSACALVGPNPPQIPILTANLP